MAKVTDPFSAYQIPPRPIPNIPPAPTPPRFTSQGSPLDRNAAAQSRARGVNVESAQEERRAEAIPAEIASGQRAPTFGDRVTPAPFTATTAVPVNPNPGSKAGGSKTR